MGGGVMHITLGRLTLAAIYIKPGVSRVRGGDNEAREEKAGRDARERLQADPAACTYAHNLVSGRYIDAHPGRKNDPPWVGIDLDVFSQVVFHASTSLHTCAGAGLLGGSRSALRGRGRAVEG
jgi:hypothetical protein